MSAVVHAEKLGDWWKVRIVTVSDGILHERTLAGRTRASVLRQVRGGQR